MDYREFYKTNNNFKTYVDNASRHMCVDVDTVLDYEMTKAVAQMYKEKPDAEPVISSEMIASCGCDDKAC